VATLSPKKWRAIPVNGKILNINSKSSTLSLHLNYLLLQWHKLFYCTDMQFQKISRICPQRDWNFLGWEASHKTPKNLKKMHEA